jgi:hypothetical protein
MLSRRGVGTAILGGMLAAALVGIFMIPVLYVIFQTTREKVKGHAAAQSIKKLEPGPTWHRADRFGGDSR